MSNASSDTAIYFNWVNFLGILLLIIERLIEWAMRISKSDCEFKMCCGCMECHEEIIRDIKRRLSKDDSGSNSTGIEDTMHTESNE
jgi:hypothetical protein